MRPALKAVALATGIFALANSWGTDRIGSVGAQEEPRPSKTARGGLLAKTQHSQFEVFFYNTGLRVFPQDAAGAPLDASRLTGTATFYHPNSPKPWFSRPLRGATATPGQASASLDLAIGLSTVPPTGAKVTFQITGLPDPADSTATFTVPFDFVKTPTESPAAHPTPPQGGVASSPRYVHGPGSYGYGYYQYPDPVTSPLRVTGPGIIGGGLGIRTNPAYLPSSVSPGSLGGYGATTRYPGPVTGGGGFIIIPYGGMSEGLMPR